MECELCEQWYHAACQNVSDAVYEAIASDSKGKGGASLLWYCRPSCNKTAEKFSKLLQTMKGRMDAIEEKVSETEKTVEEIGSRVEKIEGGEMSSKLKEEIHKLVQEEVSKGEKTKPKEDQAEGLKERVEKMEKKLSYAQATEQGQPRSQPHQENKIIQSSAKEVTDREARKGNLVWFGIAESEKEDAQERKQEDMTRMIKLGRDIFDVPSAAFTNAIRLGKKGDKPRPLLTVMDNPGTATKILQGARQLGKPEHKSLKISVKRDMTPIEREEQKKLLLLRNEKREESSKNGTREIWVVRNNKVINIQRREHKPRDGEGDKDEKE